MFPLIQSTGTGFLLMLGLIVAIGAQNAYVLRMGLIRKHVFVLCLICSVSDAVLTIAGVAGLGALVEQSQSLLKVITLGGAIFLFAYAVFALMRALNPNAMSIANEQETSLRKVILTCLAFTFLNPHVYLDTVVLVGATASLFEGTQKLAFTTGAVFASIFWFFALGYGARLLVPLFAKPKAWQILDFGIAIIMAAIAAGLLFQFFQL